MSNKKPKSKEDKSKANNKKPKSKTFKDPNCWKEANKLVLLIYETTNNFPGEEVFRLVNQIRGNSVSVISNLAEGFSKNHSREKLQFYSMALNLLGEVQKQILISKDVNYMSEEKFKETNDQINVVQKLLNALISKTESAVKKTYSKKQ